MPRLFAPKPRPTEPPKEEAAQQPAPSAGLGKEEIKELVGGAVAGVAAQLSATIQQLGQKVEELASRQPQVVVQPPMAPAAQPSARMITDEEIDQAVLSGQGAAARIRALVDRAVAQATERVINEHVKPLQEYRVTTLSELSKRVTAGGMKHYDRFKKEIDERLQMLEPAVRANPAVIEMVYHAVVGAHAEELTREAAEAAIRQAQESQSAPEPTKAKSGTSAPGTGAGAGNSREAEPVPDVAAVAGQEGLEALAHKGHGGQSADEFAKSLGYASWADYQKQYMELLKSETAGNA
jgi:hypothetical protein